MVLARTVTRFILVACAAIVSLQAQPIPEESIPALSGKTVVFLARPRPAFTAMTAGKAGLIGGLLGSGLMVSAGNKIVNENDIPDPAIAISESLLKGLQQAYQVTALTPPSAFIDVKGVDRIIERCPGADYVLDVQTTGWAFAYFPTNWAHYRTIYSVKVSLIDVKSRKVVASGKASRVPEKTSDAPSKDELLASGAARLKEMLKNQGNECAEELAIKVFRLPDAVLADLAKASASEPSKVENVVAPFTAAPTSATEPATAPDPATAPAIAPDPATAPVTALTPVSTEIVPESSASALKDKIVPIGNVAGEKWSDPLSTLEFTWIPAGTFFMGVDCGNAEEKPRHPVTISRGYWMGKYEVTQKQFESVMQAKPSKFISAGPNAPADSVTWLEAKEFVKRLNQKAGSNAYALPTEAQWEYACWAGTSSFNENLLGVLGWYKANSGYSTQPVGKLRPNAWGLHDMLGNVWELCEDWYAGKHDTSKASDPTGPATGNLRVARGGAWDSLDEKPSMGTGTSWRGTIASPNYGAKVVSPTVRFPQSPDTRADNVGFRVVVMP